jgi:hypothetical protein
VVGLWEVVPDGYMVHDYLDYQPSKERVEATREARAEAGAKGGRQAAASKNVANSQQIATAVARPGLQQNPTPYPIPYPTNTQPIDDSPPTPSVPETMGPAEPGEREIPKAHSASAPRETQEQPEQFTRLWEAYPSRDGVKGSRNAGLAEFVSKPPGEYERMVRAAEIYQLVCGPNGEHRRPKNIESFLRDDSFWQSMLDIDPATIRAKNGANGHANHQPTAERRATTVSDIVQLAESLYPAAADQPRLSGGRQGRAGPEEGERGTEQSRPGLVEGSFRSVG